jgi:hypothetical protein
MSDFAILVVAVKQFCFSPLLEERARWSGGDGRSKVEVCEAQSQGIRLPESSYNTNVYTL